MISTRRLIAQVRRAPVAQASAAWLLWFLLSGLSGIVVARALGPSGRGFVAGITAWAYVLPMVFLLGMNSALSVRVGQRLTDLRMAVASALVYVALVGLPVAALAALIVPRLIGNLGPSAVSTARWTMLVAIPAVMLTEMLLALSLAGRRFIVYSVCLVSAPLIVLLAVVIIYLVGHLTPRLVVGAQVGAGLASLILVAAMTPWRGLSFRRTEFLADLRFGTKAAVTGWAGLANARLDTLLLSVTVSVSQLGYYGVANNAMVPVTAIPFAAAAVLTPRVAALVGEEEMGSARVVRRQIVVILHAARRYFMIALAGGAVLAACAPFAVPFVFGRSFEPTVVLIWILIPGFVARAVTTIITDGAVGMRRPDVGNKAELVALVVTVVLLAALLPSFQARGAAIASTVAYTTSAFVAYRVLHRVASRAGGADTEVAPVAVEVRAPT